MTEHELTGEVIKLCDELGLLYHHCPNSSRCQGPKGFPDLIILGRYGVIFAELKSEDGENSAEQDLWAWTVKRFDQGQIPLQVVYMQWRPHDLTSERQSATIRSWLEHIR